MNLVSMISDAEYSHVVVIHKFRFTLFILMLSLLINEQNFITAQKEQFKLTRTSKSKKLIDRKCIKRYQMSFYAPISCCLPQQIIARIIINYFFWYFYLTNSRIFISLYINKRLRMIFPASYIIDDMVAKEVNIWETFHIHVFRENFLLWIYIRFLVYGWSPQATPRLIFKVTSAEPARVRSYVKIESNESVLSYSTIASIDTDKSVLE